MPLTISQSTTVNVSDTVSTTGNKLTISVAATATEIAPANTNRKGLTIENKTGKDIFVGYANTVTATNYSFSLPNNSYYEMPEPIYQGVIFGIVATGTAAPQITEFV
ncbi:MAG TPA: hypothetical protein VE956_13640 [Nodularia sp. (in: cyanobacteria)]|nr:hypothetical protein [Nodularia sp. (in: cyanobacteria)]